MALIGSPARRSVPRAGGIALLVAGLIALAVHAIGPRLAATARGHRLAAMARTALAGLPLTLNPAAAMSAPLPVPPTRIGISLTSLVWYAQDHALANLTLNSAWQQATPTGWHDLDPHYLDPDGGLNGVPPGGDAVKMLLRPDTGPAGTTIRCTYQGKADLTVHGSNVTGVYAQGGKLTFRWINRWADEAFWIQVRSVQRGAPLRQLDCRTAQTPAGVRFQPDFVAGLKGYRVLRFMDWQRANFDAPVRWETRHTPASTEFATRDGAAVEDMVALANAVDADAWFSMPWNADDEYVEHFARFVHDRLAPGHAAYVELGNEVWNWGFAMARQAGAEGLAHGRSANAQEAQQREYAARTVRMMKIWERVFADRPGRLVRVVSTQNANPHVAELVLGAPDLPAHVDALATAPYFGGDVMQEGRTDDLDEIFRRLDGRVGKALDAALANKAIAARYDKRYIAYEAGQHVVLPYDVPLEKRIQRDPRMYDLYRLYIDGWRRRIGDTLIMFGTTGAIGTGGAWGMVEHVGQDPAEAPKLRAVRDELAQP